MLSNYLLTLYRHLLKNGLVNLISVLSLTIGFACSIVLFLYVQRELSYDKHFQDAGRIYRIGTSYLNIGEFANGPVHLNERLADYTLVESTTRLANDTEVLVSSRQFSGWEENVYQVDDNFFVFFSYTFLYGNPEDCLKDIHSVVITEAVARQHFSRVDVLGACLQLGKRKTQYTITGIIEDNDFPTHFSTRMWIPFPERLPAVGNWNSAYTFNYVKLKQEITRQELEIQLNNLIKDEVYPIYRGIPYEQWLTSSWAYRLIPQPLRDIHLHSKLKFELSPSGSPLMLTILSMVAALTFSLSVFNHVNLTVARSLSRLREIGVRRTVGGTQGDIFCQFITESVIVSMIAAWLGILLMEIALSGFQILFGQNMVPSKLLDIGVYGLITLAAIVIGLVIGVYPALKLSAARVTRSLVPVYSENARVKNILVVGQFTISIALVLFSVQVIQQVDYLSTKDAGFDINGLLVVESMGSLGDDYEKFRNDVKAQSQTQEVATADRVPGGAALYLSTFHVSPSNVEVTYNRMPVDDRFIETAKLQLVAGRNFNPLTDADSTVAILNEAAVKDLVLSEPIGTRVNANQRVIGVVRDFHFKGFQRSIEPIVLTFSPRGRNLVIRLEGKPADFLVWLEKRWKSSSPDEPLSFYFVEDQFRHQLREESAFMKAIVVFTVLAIIISCLGVFGLTLFHAQIRIREISIRKVFGASLTAIYLELTRTTVKLLAVALIFGLIFSTYFSSQWRGSFDYKAPLNVLFSLAGILFLVLMVFCTIFISSRKVAVSNPVDILKGE